MINAGRQISWLGTNLSSVSKQNLSGLGHRTITSGHIFNQKTQAEETNEEKGSKTFSETSTYEPPAAPVISRSYLDEHRRSMKPFMKELFCGRVDTRVLSYPDVINNDAYHDIFQRCGKVRNTLKEKKDLVDSIDSNGKVSKDLLLALRSQGFYGLYVPEKQGGEGLSLTESLCMIEELSVNLSLSESIVTPLTLGYKALELYGTEQQKSKYLPSLITGQKIGAICISDKACGSDPNSTTVCVREDTDDGTYTMNGTKTWVANGPSADLFIVFANLISRGNTMRTIDTSLAPQPRLTAFLVESSMPGVIIHSDKVDKKVGLKGLETCPVTFNDVTLSPSHRIGEEGKGAEVLYKTLSSDRIVSAAKITSSLRMLLDETIRYACRRKQFQKRLSDFELIQFKLATSACHLFALESAVYMTAGLADYQKEPDIEIESAAIKRHAVKMAREITETCFSILGSSTYLEDNRFKKIANDLNAYNWWEGTDEMLAFHITVSGIAYASASMQESVKHQRNPLTYPIDALKRIFKNYRVYKDKPKLSLLLGDHVHPSLSNIAESVEYFVHRFFYALEVVLVKHGQDTAFKEVDLARLSDIATEIFLIISAMARANRSYCEGHEHADHEVALLMAYIDERELHLKRMIHEVLTGYWQKRDNVTLDLAKYMIERGRYCPVHPVTKNWF